MDVSSFKSLITQIFSNESNYITPATRAHFISFTFYNPSSDQFGTVVIITEFLTSGNVIPSALNVIPFKMNVFELSSEKFIQATDFFRLFLMFYVGYTMFVKGKALIKGHNLIRESKAVLTLSLILDFAIIFFFSFAWILSYYYSDDSSLKAINKNLYKDYWAQAIWF